MFPRSSRTRRTGRADLPLHSFYVPKRLAEGMTRVGRLCREPPIILQRDVIRSIGSEQELSEGYANGHFWALSRSRPDVCNRTVTGRSNDDQLRLQLNL